MKGWRRVSEAEHEDLREGARVGVLGGYEDGGITAAISYSPYLGQEVQRLYRLAASGSGAALANYAIGLRAQ